MIWWLAQNTAVAAFLAVLVLAVCRFARLGPAARHALWLLVLVKLVMPPIVSWPWDVPSIWPAGALASPPSGEESNAAALPGAEVRLTDGHDLGEPTAPGVFLAVIHDELLQTPRSRPVGEFQETATSETDKKDDNAPRGVAFPIWLPPAAFYVWLIGVALMASLQAVRLTRLWHLLKLARPGPRWLLRQVRDLGSRMGVRTPRPLVVPGAGSPVVCGIGRARLLWPAKLLDTLPAGSRRSVVVHELAHLRRRDHWVGWLLLAAECVWWWNPLFWLVRRQVRNQAELACDAWVVTTLPGDRRAYAEALIEVSRLVSTAALPVPAVGMSGGSRQAFTERLTMIMRDGAPCKLSLRGCLVLVGLATLLLPGWSLAQRNDEKREAKKDIEVRVIVDDKEKTAQPEERKRININVLGDAVQEFDGDILANMLVWQAGDGDGDQKLQELEKKLEAMLKELRELRTAKPKGTPAPGAAPANRTPVYQLRQAISAPAGVKVVGAADVDITAAIKQLEEAMAKNPSLKEPLQKAIDALRSVEKNAAGWRRFGERIQVQGKVDPAEKPKGPAVTPPAGGGARTERRVITLQGPAGSTTAPGSTTTITLSRTTYKLENKAKADALAAFLKEHVKASILEVKAEGESLTITTTPETQKAIGQLISITGGEKTKTSSAREPQIKLLGEKLKALEAIEGIKGLEGLKALKGAGLELKLEGLKGFEELKLEGLKGLEELKLEGLKGLEELKLEGLRKLDDAKVIQAVPAVERIKKRVEEKKAPEKP
jgi:beta-lactamase regulating signal transducer with metallopeptidase domain